MQRRIVAILEGEGLVATPRLDAGCVVLGAMAETACLAVTIAGVVGCGRTGGGHDRGAFELSGCAHMGMPGRLRF